VSLPRNPARITCLPLSNNFRKSVLSQPKSCIESSTTIARHTAEPPSCPVSGSSHTFAPSAAWLGELAGRDLFGVRKGILKFRGFIPNKTPVPGNKVLTDADFKPLFEQKGVDMRIGLDIANYAQNQSVRRILLVSNDTDCIPALKLARISGLQTVLICLPGRKPHSELAAHADYVRNVSWP
jgi:uncharacterized LabA/DUF88 family protein